MDAFMGAAAKASNPDKAPEEEDGHWERYPWAATAQQLRTTQFDYESSSDESDGEETVEEGAEERKEEPLLSPLPEVVDIPDPPEKTTDGQLEDFVDALQKRQLGRVCRLHRLGFDLDASLTDDGERALHFAADSPGMLDVLICLLSLGANADAVDAHGRSAAHRCAASDSKEGLEALFKHNANIDAEDKRGYAPAHVAAALGKASALEFLLHTGVHVERLHKNGFTLALFAAHAGHLAALQVVVKKGAAVRRPCFVDHDLIRGRRVQTTLMQVALYEGHKHVAEWLRDSEGVGKWESELVVVDEKYMAWTTRRWLVDEAAFRAAGRAQRAWDRRPKAGFAAPGVRIYSPRPPPGGFPRLRPPAPLPVEDKVVDVVVEAGPKKDS
jgi:hypothetical protein